MNQRTVAIVLGIPFLAITAYAVSQVGYWGIIEPLLQDSAGWQVFADLVIALVLLLTFLIPDAKSRGINPWPWVIATCLLGSIGPLGYFVYRGK